MTTIREAAVAGQFYPSDAQELSRTVDDLLDEAESNDAGAPKALIAPHAGLVYSGPVAAAAYARLRPHRDRYERVVLIGPCHRVPVHGFAFSGADVFRMPLGDVPVDKKAIADIHLPQVRVFDATHKLEHSLELHLPFLQSVLGEFTLVPIVVGDTTHQAVADVLDALWGGPETLIVVSSDLSHYLSYEKACTIDNHTRQSIENLQSRGITHHAACGATPIGGLLINAKRRGMTVTTLDLRNSGDTVGTRQRVVGYGSWMFVEQ